MELPVADGDLEDRASAGDGQFGDTQTIREVAAERDPDRRAGPRGRYPAGCVQCVAGLRQGRRRAAGAAYGCRWHRVYRLHRGRQALAAMCRSLEHETCVHGMWRHEPEPDLDRKSVVWGKSVSVRVDLGGRRIIKKKQKTSKITQE